jgi:hypothetical protein
MPHSADDPTALTPERRRREIAGILARGVLRLHCMRQVGPAPWLAHDPPESPESRLEAPTPSRPHVTGS